MVAAGKHLQEPDEAWISTDPFRSGVRVNDHRPAGLQRQSAFAIDDQPAALRRGAGGRWKSDRPARLRRCSWICATMRVEVPLWSRMTGRIDSNMVEAGELNDSGAWKRRKLLIFG